MHRPQLLGEDPEHAPWMTEAACAEVGGDAWFPEQGDAVEPARAVCRRCPVATQCLEYAVVNHIGYGMWGGQTALQRARRRRKEVA